MFDYKPIRDKAMLKQMAQEADLALSAGAPGTVIDGTGRDLMRLLIRSYCDKERQEALLERLDQQFDAVVVTNPSHKTGQ